MQIRSNLENPYWIDADENDDEDFMQSEVVKNEEHMWHIEKLFSIKLETSLNMVHDQLRLKI